MRADKKLRKKTENRVLKFVPFKILVKSQYFKIFIALKINDFILSLNSSGSQIQNDKFSVSRKKRVQGIVSNLYVSCIYSEK